jgi:hypothetical protein
MAKPEEKAQAHLKHVQAITRSRILRTLGRFLGPETY